MVSDGLADAVGSARVREAMTSPVVSCRPSLPLRGVAELMDRGSIHAVIVRGAGDGDMPAPEGEPWRVVSETDLLGGLVAEGPEMPVGRAADTPLVVVDANESIDRAAALMVEFGVSHLVAVGEDGEPVGVLSCLDVAGLLSDGRL